MKNAGGKNFDIESRGHPAQKHLVTGAFGDGNHEWDKEAVDP
jgi:hypothetical protein